MGKLTRYVPFTKVDDDQRMVTGIMTSEAVDTDDEIIDYDAAVRAINKDGGYAQWRNVRAMHGQVAAGVADDIVCDDGARQVVLTAKVVDDAEWRKVKAGVYKGFSAGGRSNASTVQIVGGRPVVRHTDVEFYEVSLVDRPANPEAVFTLVKLDRPKEGVMPENNEAQEAVHDAVVSAAADEARGSAWDASEIQEALTVIGYRIAGELSEGEPEQAAKLQAARKMLLEWLQAETGEVDAAIAQVAAIEGAPPAGAAPDEAAPAEATPAEAPPVGDGSIGEAAAAEGETMAGAQGGDQLVASEEATNSEVEADGEDEDEDIEKTVAALCAHPGFAKFVQSQVQALLTAQIQKGGKPVSQAFVKLDDVAARLGALEKRVTGIAKAGAASGPVLRDVTGVMPGSDGDARLLALDELIKTASDPNFRQNLMQERARLAIARVHAGGGTPAYR